MATFTQIRSDGKLVDDGYVNETGGAATHTKTNDKSDTTWIKKSKNTAQSFGVSLANPSTARPQSTEFVWYTRARARMACSSGGNLALRLGTTKTVSGAATPSNLVTVATQTGAKALPTAISISSSTVTAGGAAVLTVASHSFVLGDTILVTGVTGGSASQYNGTWQVTAVSSTTISFTGNAGSGLAGSGGTVAAAWNVSGNVYTFPGSGLLPTQTDINNLSLVVLDSATATGARSTIYELFVDVVTTPIPTASNIQVSNNGNTTRPTISFDYTQTDGVDYGGAVVKVFSAVPTDPETNTALLLWSTTLSANSDRSVTVGVDLPSASVTPPTLYAYVKVASDPSGLFDGKHNAWSAWVNQSFTITLATPTVPSFGTVTWTNQIVTIPLTGATYTGTSQTFELQRSTDSGSTWNIVRGCDALVPDGSFAVTAYDYEAPRPSTTLRYRVRANGINSGYRRTSAWSSNQTVNTTNDSQWHIIDVTNPTSNVTGSKLDCRVLEGLDVQQNEDVGVFRPLGRTKPVVVHGDIEGQDGSFQVLASGDTEFARVLALLNCQRTLLLRAAYGDQKYIRVTQRSWNKTGAIGAPRYYFTVQFVEVESGETAG